MIPEFTTVLGVDEGHLNQFKISIPTWARHKPEIFKNPMVIFTDDLGVRTEIIGFLKTVKPVGGWSETPINTVQWPLPWMVHSIEEKDRFSNLQRYRMLSGFVHVPAQYVKTPYWLKLDLDVVATGCPDWINPQWFENSPAIIGHPWGYTKPPGQMIQLDEWVAESPVKLISLSSQPPLNLAPNPGSDIVRHKRIISWCAFFETEFTRQCSQFAEKSCGAGMLPVPSQDGFMFYVAKRLGRTVVRANMKSLGWSHCSSEKNMREAIRNGQQSQS